jgi:hypothetical protein
VGRLGSPPEFRRKVRDLVASGRKVSDVAFASRSIRGGRIVRATFQRLRTADDYVLRLG